MSDTFFSKLVGVTFESRQDHISDLLDLIEEVIDDEVDLSEHDLRGALG